MSRILTSHVGSLPRTQEVVDYIFARENSQNIMRRVLMSAWKRMF